MHRTLITFIITFVVFMILNQAAFGNCFAAYCLIAALPMVTVMASIATAAIVYILKQAEKMQEK